MHHISLLAPSKKIEKDFENNAQHIECLELLKNKACISLNFEVRQAKQNFNTEHCIY